MKERLFCCRACKVSLRPFDGDEAAPPEVLDAMVEYCRTCAEEKLGLSVLKVGTLQHGTGGGHRVIRSTKPMS